MATHICLPIYNEEKIMAASIKRLLDYLATSPITDWQIVLLINGSNDSSEMIGQQLVNDYPGKIKLEVIPQGGKGRAIINYFQKAPADILVYMDIDLAVSLADLPALIDAIKQENYDLSFGSRLKPGAKTDRQFIREMSSRAYNLFSRLLLHHHFYDLQCGFKAMKGTVAKAIMPQIDNQEWFFDTELIVLAHRAGYRLKEIPVDWQEERYEQRESKIRMFRDAWIFIKKLVGLHFKIKKNHH